MTDDSEQWVVAVAGMHRSGTSAVTGVLSLLGGDLPRRLMPAHESNTLGHFEPDEIVNIHDQLLASAGSSWDDWRQFRTDWLESSESAEFVDRLMAAFNEDFEGSPLALLKDPRLCRIIPLWQSIFSKLGRTAFYVLPYRNPIEVAQSLRDRNSIEPYASFTLWLRHVLEAEAATRDRPRIFLRYEDLLRDPHSTVTKIVSSTPFAWPKQLDQAFDEISSLVRLDLRHHQVSADQLDDDVQVSAWARRAYRCYEILQDHPLDSASMQELDEIRSDFDTAVASIFSTRALRGPEEAINNEPNRTSALFDLRLREARLYLNSSSSCLNVVPLPTHSTSTNPSEDILQKSLRIGYLYALLGQHTSAMLHKDEQLEHYAKRLDILTTQHRSEADKVAELSNELLLTENQTRVYSETASALNKTLAIRETQIEELRSELSSTLQQLSALETELELARVCLTASRSWRIVWPLGWLRKFFGQ